MADALRENLPSILGVAKPFIPRSKMKPRTLPSSHLAHTTAMSATGEFVILGDERESKMKTSVDKRNPQCVQIFHLDKVSRVLFLLI